MADLADSPEMKKERPTELANMGLHTTVQKYTQVFDRWWKTDKYICNFQPSWEGILSFLDLIVWPNGQDISFFLVHFKVVVVHPVDDIPDGISDLARNGG